MHQLDKVSHIVLMESSQGVQGAAEVTAPSLTVPMLLKAALCSLTNCNNLDVLKGPCQR